MLPHDAPPQQHLSHRIRVLSDEFSSLPSHSRGVEPLWVLNEKMWALWENVRIMNAVAAVAKLPKTASPDSSWRSWSAPPLQLAFISRRPAAISSQGGLESYCFCLGDLLEKWSSCQQVDEGSGTIPQTLCPHWGVFLRWVLRPGVQSRWYPQRLAFSLLCFLLCPWRLLLASRSCRLLSYCVPCYLLTSHVLAWRFLLLLALASGLLVLLFLPVSCSCRLLSCCVPRVLLTPCFCMTFSSASCSCLWTSCSSFSLGFLLLPLAFLLRFSRPVGAMFLHDVFFCFLLLLFFLWFFLLPLDSCFSFLLLPRVLIHCFLLTALCLHCMTCSFPCFSLCRVVLASFCYRLLIVFLATC